MDKKKIFNWSLNNLALQEDIKWVELINDTEILFENVNTSNSILKIKLLAVFFS